MSLGMILVQVNDLLKQGAPKLIWVFGLEVDEPAMPRGQPVVHTNLYPLAKTEETEPKDSTVVDAEVLTSRHHPVKADVVVRQVGEGGQEPAVADLSLVDVETVPLPDHHGRLQPHVGADISWPQPLNLISGQPTFKVAGDDFLIAKNTGVCRESRVLKKRLQNEREKQNPHLPKLSTIQAVADQGKIVLRLNCQIVKLC